MKALIVGLFVFFSATTTLARDYVGEKSVYYLDKDRNRTSGFIKAGNAVAKNIAEVTGGYRISVFYSLDIRFIGVREGTETFVLEKKLFTEEFLSELRTKKKMETTQMNLEHLGYVDARTMDGKKYDKSDRILATKIKIKTEGSGFGFVESIAQGLSTFYNVAENTVENLKVLLTVKYGEPVVGAVKLDVAGSMSGTSFSAGFDFAKAQSSKISSQEFDAQ